MIPIYEYICFCGINCCRGINYFIDLDPGNFNNFVIQHIIKDFPEECFMTVEWPLYYNGYRFKKEGNYFKIILNSWVDKLEACKFLFGTGHFDNNLQFHSDLDDNVIKKKYLDKNGDFKIKKLNVNQLQNFIQNKGITPKIKIKKCNEENILVIDVESEENSRVLMSIIGYFSSSLQCDKKMVWITDNVFTLLNKMLY